MGKKQEKESENMVKKIAASLLAVLLLLAASACSNGFPSAPDEASSGSESSSSASPPPSSAPASSAQSPAPSSSPPSSAPASSARPASSPKTGSKTGQVPSEAPKPEKAKTVRLTFPEGFTLAQIAARLEKNGVCTQKEFVKAAQTYDFSYYSLVKKIPASAKRAYKLEGYLYPDTYEFYTDMKPQDAVGRFLRNAESAIGSKYAYPGMTTDQVITLASIIEREADNADEMKKVSSVFHNRLKAKMILQADSTRDYCNNYLIPVFGDSYKYYYNTYPGRAPALPAGPICNPGAAALSAAANPVKTDFLYFATGTNHKYYYGKTQAERDAQMKADGVTPLYKD